VRTYIISIRGTTTYPCNKMKFSRRRTAVPLFTPVAFYRYGSFRIQDKKSKRFSISY